MTRCRIQSGLRQATWLALGIVGLVAACSSGSDPHATNVPVGGSSSSDAGTGGTAHDPLGGSGGSGGRGGSDSAAAGQGGEGADMGAAGAAGAAGSQEGTVVVAKPGACSETAAWSGAAPLPVVSTTADEHLLSITADELDIVFVRSGAVYRSHRDASSASFGAPSTVALPTGYVADAGVALSGDGLTLVLVSSDGLSFGALSRAARSDDFRTSADTSAFLGLNARALQTLEHFAAPVLAPDGKSFVFTGFTPGADGTSVVYESLWAGSEWAMPNNISRLATFDGTGDKRPLPTGLSSDSRTLFYFDEATSKEVARFRDRPDAPLYHAVDLGGLAGAMPNGKCDRIYYSSTGDVLTVSSGQ